jgi:uncharacterized protein (DUF924 family)
MANHRPDDVLAFWFGEGSEYGKRHPRWFEKDAAFDADVTARFRDLHARLSANTDWLDPARACLARVIVLDQFPRHIYLPFEHSEALADQERACALCAPLRDHPETDDAYRYAVAHRDIVRRFGRFPHRNAILGRTSTPAELEFLKQPGSAF